MARLSNPRQFFFNKIDALKGANKSKHYADIKKRIESQLDNKEQLQKLLAHACTTTLFYKQFNHNKGLETFPVINKNLIKARYSHFQSEKFKHTKNRVAATSGSTGAPFKILQNPDKVNRNFADTLYFSERAGYTMGNQLYYFRLWKAYEKKNILERWMTNMVPIDVYDLKDDYIKTLIDRLKSSKAEKSWTGYASAFETICKYLDKTQSKPINCNLKSAIAISESLSPYTKQQLKTYFGVDTVSRYSNVENGIMAQQLPGHSHFTINTASYHIEVLEMDSDAPVENGKPGRIVVTDLYNYCMPLIRYDTGDIGIIDIIDGNRVLSAVEGRKVDTITNTQGELVPNSLMMLVNNYHELKQCQLIQKSAKQYVLKVNIDGEFKKEQQFINDFKSYLGTDAQISIDYVNDIPLLASGKRRAMVNEMNL